MANHEEHNFLGGHDGKCTWCNKTAPCHRVEHAFGGPACVAAKCTLNFSQHRRHHDGTNRKKNTYAEDVTYYGLDGEGQGRLDHRYVLLGANSEDGKHPTWVAPKNGIRITTQEFLDFILTLWGKTKKVFSFSFNYDLTQGLRDLDEETLFLIFRPEKHPGKYGPTFLKWVAPDGEGYLINLQGTKFTVKKPGGQTVIVWDLFKFYQAKFVTALEQWKVGDKAMLERMKRMKDKRAEFDKEDPAAVRAYCLEECRYIGELAHKLVDAHSEVGLQLKTFYGAGSTGALILNDMNIKEKLRSPPPEMLEAIACGFFGGRFENSVIGTIRGTHMFVEGQDGPKRFYHSAIYDYDISSAYPYQLTQLPCLLHGTWKLEKGKRARSKLEKSRTALVRYSLEFDSNVLKGSWGPFPFRTSDGSISYPASGGGGWMWKDEYLAGERMFPNVVFHEAWVYTCDCDCVPFAKIPYFYSQRVLIGKEGAGIVLKLGPNSVYGKIAQSIGNAVFQNWIYAGLITSGTRAQLLEVMGLHEDWANILVIATDGIKTRERIITPRPADTGTWLLKNEKGEEVEKPLGGWEEKIVEKGLFVARPGIYFPLQPTDEEIKDVRGRGVGKGVVLENWEKIMQSYSTHGAKMLAPIANVTRFCGGKTSISYKPSNKTYNRAHADPGPCSIIGPREAEGEDSWPPLCRHGGACDNSKPSYGQWIARSVEMSFDPMPKRERINPDGITLALRYFPQDLMSIPYNNALKSKEALELAAAYQELMEQPDADYVDDSFIQGGI